MTWAQDAATSETRASVQLRESSGGRMQLNGQPCIVTPKNSLELTKQNKNMKPQHTRGKVKILHKGRAAFDKLRPQGNGCNAR